MKRMERTARMQQRLAAVGEMAAGIAHEIRNPLASMSGSMQMLRQELSLSGDQAQLMDIVLKESDRLNQTIKSFLAYARPQRAQSTRLDLRTLVTETAMLLRNGPDVGERHTVGLAVCRAARCRSRATRARSARFSGTSRPTACGRCPRAGSSRSARAWNARPTAPRRPSWRSPIAASA